MSVQMLTGLIHNLWEGVMSSLGTHPTLELVGFWFLGKLV